MTTTGITPESATREEHAPKVDMELEVVVSSDIQAARDALAGLGVEIGDVFHPRAQFVRGGADRVSGPAPDHATYGSFATFSDPDGNEWLLKEITQRLPAESTPPGRRSRRRTIWRTTWWRSRRAASCGRERGRRDTEGAACTPR
jgi:hypothetical protein